MMNNVVFMLNAAGDKVSSLPEALAVAGFTIAVVFANLILIYFCIVFFSKLINIFEKQLKASDAKKVAKKTSIATIDKKEASTEHANKTSEDNFSSGSLKLKNCDEKTAAMIMAILSDETKIPLSELVFKSITLVEKK
ncbi:MAG: OadG family protein [Clostridiaceae bacterium]|nr:OadG family protein [Clostridiaceae bacterium]